MWILGLKGLTGFLENIYIKAIKCICIYRENSVLIEKNHVEAQIIITNQSMHTLVGNRVAIFLILSK